ncbi:MAG: hypothetical protein NTU76_01640 [Candidatus Taylorbacteria bacterium]|nr:hypothetical protein [Candidatus Taylorbacteria bacterium]
MNTTQKGSVRCIVFKDSDTWYAVALEFNIVESSDDPMVAQNNLDEAIRGYVESQRKIKGSRVAPLNQKTDSEYESLWGKLVSNKPIPSPYKVRSFGFTKI